MQHQERLRVLTLNLWGRQGDWARRREVLRAGLQHLRPDLVAFQESVLVDGYDQAADLLGPDYHITHQSGRSADGVGAVIASRWPVGSLREVDLHLTSRVDRSVGWIGSVALAEIRVPAPFGSLLFVHHKPSWQWGFEHERELQAAAAAKAVEEVVRERSVHVLLAGDFDAPRDAASIRFWHGLQSLEGISVCYVDAWEWMHPDDVGYTFTPGNPLVRSGEMPLERGRRIDYIMVRCGYHGPTLEVSACALAFHQPVGGVWASDHFGVVADFMLPGSEVA